MQYDGFINFQKLLFGTYMRVLLNLDFLQNEAYPEGGKIFASNHPTTTDPFFLPLISKESIHILITGAAWEVPGFGWLLNRCGHIPVVRGKGQGQIAIDRALGYLIEGRSVGIYPEGAISPSSHSGFGIHPPHSGVGRIALASGAPVIPVGVSLTKENIWEKEVEFEETGKGLSRVIRGGSYAITVGSPMYFAGDPEDRHQVAWVGQRVMEEVRSLSIQSEQRLEKRGIQWNSLLNFRNLISILTR